jgi:hypothetical protein
MFSSGCCIVLVRNCELGDDWLTTVVPVRTAVQLRLADVLCMVEVPMTHVRSNSRMAILKHIFPSSATFQIPASARTLIPTHFHSQGSTTCWASIFDRTEPLFRGVALRPYRRIAPLPTTFSRTSTKFPPPNFEARRALTLY